MGSAVNPVFTIEPPSKTTFEIMPPKKEEKGILRKVWDALNTPTADFVLPEGVKTADILKGVAFKQLGLGEYMPGVNDENTVDLKKGPVKAALQKFVRGATADTAEMAAGFTSPLSVGTAGAGAATKLPGVIGTVAKAVSGTAAAGFGAKGTMQTIEALPGAIEGRPEEVQRALGGAATAVGGAAGMGNVARFLAQPAKALSQRLYQSALKPPTTTKVPKLASALEAGMEFQIPVSRVGLQNLGKLIENYNSKVAAKIASQPQAAINKFAVTRRLTETAKKFEQQVNPADDLAAISKSGEEFLTSQPSRISAARAQELKVGTYRQLKGRSYGELKSATIEAQKSLARGLKEEIENLFPEIKNLNAKQSKMLNLEPMVERAIQRIENQQLLGIGTPITGVAAGVATGSAGAGVAAAFLKAVFDSPGVKSRLAIAIHDATRGAKPFNVTEARIAALSTALANVSASGDQPNSRKD